MVRWRVLGYSILLSFGTIMILADQDVHLNWLGYFGLAIVTCVLADMLGVDE